MRYESRAFGWDFQSDQRKGPRKIQLNENQKLLRHHSIQIAFQQCNFGANISLAHTSAAKGLSEYVVVRQFD
jgi:hypothetical protein